MFRGQFVPHSTAGSSFFVSPIDAYRRRCLASISKWPDRQLLFPMVFAPSFRRGNGFVASSFSLDRPRVLELSKKLGRRDGPQQAQTCVTRNVSIRSFDSRGINGSNSSTTDVSDIYRQEVAWKLSLLSGIDVSIILSKLQSPSTFDNGDLQLSLPSLLVKGISAREEQAADWVTRWPSSELVEDPLLEGSFLVFRFRPSPLIRTLVPQILHQGASFGYDPTLGLRQSNDPSQGKRRVVVEFSSPNIAKPFHAGHLRSTIIGAFLANLYEVSGWDVVRVNYLGDWGKQFGLLAVAFARFGDETKLRANPIGHLFDIYVKINKESATEDLAIGELKGQLNRSGLDSPHAITLKSQLEIMIAKSADEEARRFFQKLESSDPNALGLWKQFRDLSIEKYKETYSQWDIKFDHFSGESQVEKSRVEQVVLKLKETGMCTEEAGATRVNFKDTPGAKKLGKAVVQKSDGSSIYLTRDVAEAIKRHEIYHFDKMIYVVATQQDLYIAQMLKVLELVGHEDIARVCSHINFGMVRGMSTRKGTVKFLDDILREVSEKVHDIMKGNRDNYAKIQDPAKTADILGKTAIIIQDMKGKRRNGYDFSLERMTSFEGDTGPYLQYAHVRLCSIRRKTEISDYELLTADLSLLTEPQAVNLVRVLLRWPEVVQLTMKNHEPSTIVSYLFKLTHALSIAYNSLKVVGSEREVMKARMALYEAVRQVLWNGMKLLGLYPVDRM